MTAKQILKSMVRAVFILAALPAALLSGFGRIRVVFAFFAQAYSQVPGLPGDYLRVAYYSMTLEKCSLESCISFGTFFAHPEASVAERVYIGSYCVIGRAQIGERTQIASGVQILSGSRQHTRDAGGQITGSDQGEFSTIHIGADCWIGAAAVVMADVGAGSTIGAGAVVSRAIPEGSTAVGVPARVIG